MLCAFRNVLFSQFKYEEGRMKHEDILEKGILDRALIKCIHDSGLGSLDYNMCGWGYVELFFRLIIYVSLI